MSTQPNTYDIGDTVVLEATFTATDDGDEADPTAVALTVWRPDGTLDEIDAGDISNPAVGNYRHDYALADGYPPGTVWYRWVGTGAVAGAEEGKFVVQRRRVPAAS